MSPEELADKFDYLAIRWSLRYTPLGVPATRILEAGRAALANAAMHYEPARGAFAPFARKEIRRKAARMANATRARGMSIMNVTALRRALHACADLICDALEEDASTPGTPAPKRPKTRRGPRPEAPIRRVEISPELRESTLRQARRNGIL